MKKQTDHDDRNKFYWEDVVARWNGLVLCAAFTLLFLLGSLDGFGEGPFLMKIGFGGIVVYIWFITVNMWFFHRMRRKKEIQKAKQRIRWMLKVKPWVYVGTTLSCLLVFFPFWLHDTMKDNELFISIIVPLVAPFFLTKIWSGVATTPFHTGYGGRPNRER
ncbi:MAG: hypothetical protein FWH27_05905 [Planctomycetaceae bacterium]|nr:hypothetical protein [Planctomycetaceae bacterium]